VTDVETLKEKFKDRVKVTVRSERRIYVGIDPKDIVEIGLYLHEDLGCRFATASCVDTRRGFEILYHFSKDQTGQFISLRVIVPRENPTIESLGKDLPAAEWIEREIAEFFGVTFEGHPDPRRLLSSEDRPLDFKPFRRDMPRTRSEEEWRGK
jgi:NADH-quinone oxidoreductase subunit C